MARPSAAHAERPWGFRLDAKGLPLPAQCAACLRVEALMAQLGMMGVMVTSLWASRLVDDSRRCRCVLPALGCAPKASFEALCLICLLGSPPCAKSEARRGLNDTHGYIGRPCYGRHTSLQSAHKQHACAHVRVVRALRASGMKRLRSCLAPWRSCRDVVGLHTYAQDMCDRRGSRQPSYAFGLSDELPQQFSQLCPFALGHG